MDLPTKITIWGVIGVLALVFGLLKYKPRKKEYLPGTGKKILTYVVMHDGYSSLGTPDHEVLKNAGIEEHTFASITPKGEITNYDHKPIRLFAVEYWT